MRVKHWILTLVPLSILAADQWTKMIIIDKFALGESIPVISSFFNLTYVRNTGAAFGFLAAAHPSFRIPFFLAIPVIALVVIGLLFKKLPERDIKTAMALSLVMGGAVGNLIDRVRFGYVVDFLDFHWKFQAHFPAFNVADSAICVGVALLMFDFSKRERA
ncbi:signal peptidase II [bacterium]|nr:signal peptidase II [bacterium]